MRFAFKACHTAAPIKLADFLMPLSQTVTNPYGFSKLGNEVNIVSGIRIFY